MTTIEDRRSQPLRSAAELEIALPAPGSRLDQDEEWVVARTPDGWRRIRLHDYDQVFSVPGLYERWIYDVLQCKSPEVVRRQLEAALRRDGIDPADLTVLDLGAGNGCVAEELRGIGMERFVGIDIHPEAEEAAERDRPGLYCDYVIGDLTNLDAAGRATLDRHDYDCLTCVAALGFGDIPVAVFAEAYNRVKDGGWIAFTIKTDFLDEADDSGFSRLIRRMLADGVLDLDTREEYQHRMSTDGQPLIYEAFLGRKRGAIPARVVSEIG